MTPLARLQRRLKSTVEHRDMLLDDLRGAKRHVESLKRALEEAQDNLTKMREEYHDEANKVYDDHR